MQTSLLALIAAGVGPYSSSAGTVTLGDLALSKSTGVQGAQSGTKIGDLIGMTAGATQSIYAVFNDQGVLVSSNKFALDSAGVQLLTGTDGPVAGTYHVKVRQTLPGASNSPYDTDLLVTIQPQAVPVGTLRGENIGERTAVGTEVAVLQTGATISGPNSNHFTVSAGGSVQVSLAGDGADLSAGTYTFVVTGDTRYTALTFSIDTGQVWDVCTKEQLVAAYAAAPVIAGSGESRINVRAGYTLNPRNPTDVANTTVTITGREFAGATLIDPYAGLDEFSVIASDPNARATMTGAYCRLTCRVKGGAYMDGNWVFSGAARGLIVDNLRFIAIGTVGVIMAPNAANISNAMGDGVARTGGTGFESSGTWQWSPDGVESISGTWAATAGVITSAAITAKTAGIDAAVTVPILLSTSKSTINGAVTEYGTGKINTASGVNGFIILTHDNFNKGPLNASQGILMQQCTASQLSISGSTSNGLPPQWPVAIVRDCFFGGLFKAPNNPMWFIGGLATRFVDRVTVEDCRFDGSYGGIGNNIATEIIFRRCDCNQTIGDSGDFYQSSSPFGTITLSAAATATATVTLTINGAIVTTGATTAGSKLVSRVDMQRLQRTSVGMSVSGAGIPGGATIESMVANPYGFNQVRVIIDQCHFINPVTIWEWLNFHADGVQLGTMTNVLGTVLVLTRNIMFMLGTSIAEGVGFANLISSQGLYIDDDGSSIGGFTELVRGNLIIAKTQAGIILFRNQSDTRSRATRNTVISATGVYSDYQTNAGHQSCVIQVQGRGIGPVIDGNVTAAVYDSSGSPMASAVITAKGTGYAAGDKIFWSNGYGIIAVATVQTVDSNGGILTYAWDNGITPNGIGAAASATTVNITDIKSGSTVIHYTIKESVDANGYKTTFVTGNGQVGALVDENSTAGTSVKTGTGIYSVAGSGANLRITAQAPLNPVLIHANGTFRKNTDEDDITITNNAFVDLARVEDVLVGPITYVDPTNDATKVTKGFTFPVGDPMDRAAFRAAMIAATTGKGAAAGIGWTNV